MNEWWVFDPVTGTYPSAQRVPILRTTAAYSDFAKERAQQPSAARLN